MCKRMRLIGVGNTFNVDIFSLRKPSLQETGLKIDKQDQGRRNGGAWRGHFPLLFERGATGTKVPVNNNIIGNFRDAAER